MQNKIINNNVKISGEPLACYSALPYLYGLTLHSTAQHSTAQHSTAK